MVAAELSRTRADHRRAGFRRKGGPMYNENSKYELTFPEFNTSDPYQPQVKNPT